MKLKNFKVKTISLADACFPSLLKEIPNPPSEIYILGDLSQGALLKNEKIAIVGTRKATFQGKAIAKKIAKELSQKGMVIVSGLAMGIDTAAHEGAIEAGGKTIAVLACGLDNIYPRQNENLAQKIIDFGGIIISEYPIGAPPFPNQFLERNRIVSGLSIASIVIEAPVRSGALVTARLAAEQGREVFVIPGSIENTNYYGSHKLIRDGARLAVSVEDILEDLGLVKECENQDTEVLIEEINDKNQLFIIKVIKQAGKAINIDKIIEITKLEPQMVNQSLTLLLMKGLIEEVREGYIIKKN
ncbi:DNA-processing protein DprA [Candidatus Wolfebacteria bacterium]|nr:DNA-processing protein DprA [Candidatus Wolfebacteria bacterium]